MVVFGRKMQFSRRKPATKYLFVKPSVKSQKAFIGLSLRAKIVAGGRPLLRENLAKTDSPPSKMMISNQYSLVVLQP